MLHSSRAQPVVIRQAPGGSGAQAVEPAVLHCSTSITQARAVAVAVDRQLECQLPHAGSHVPSCHLQTCPVGAALRLCDTCTQPCLPQWRLGLVN